MLRTYQYRIYPSKAQEKRLEETVETCRRFYNTCLAERKEAYEERGESVGKVQQLRLVKTEKANNPYAAGIHSHVLQVVVTDLDKAFQAFFRRVKSGEEKPGYPRFRGEGRFSSFGLKELNNGFGIKGKKLRLSGIGNVSVRWHRPIIGKIKSLRVVKKADGWYTCFACEVGEGEPLPKTGKIVGVDVGLKTLLMLSDGTAVENPRWLKGKQSKLRVLGRMVKRKTLGSNNRRKAANRLAKEHQTVANARKDFLDKVADKLVRNYDTLVLEKLTITKMVRDKKFSRGIMDAAWGYLVKRLQDKAEWASREVIQVNPANTSNTCSGCGKRFEGFSIATRQVSCSCGIKLNRDLNAAINIKTAGTQPLGSHFGLGTALSGVSQEATGIYPV